jgi:hypothetical protein
MEHGHTQAPAMRCRQHGYSVELPDPRSRAEAAVDVRGQGGTMQQLLAILPMVPVPP